jgi:hypothetical protein
MDDQRTSLSRAQKRLLVYGRLVMPDAAQLSDRAVARELGVSQPFVSARRRVLREWLATGGNSSRDLNRNKISRPRSACESPTGELDVLGADDDLWASSGRATTAQQSLDRLHDEWGPIGRVRRVAWPAEEERGDPREEWDWPPE